MHINFFESCLMAALILAAPPKAEAKGKVSGGAPGTPPSECRGKPSAEGRYILRAFKPEIFDEIKRCGDSLKIFCTDPQDTIVELKDTRFTTTEGSLLVVASNGAIAPSSIVPEEDWRYDRGFYMCEDQSITFGSVDEFYLCPYEEFGGRKLSHIRDQKTKKCELVKNLAIRCLEPDQF